MKRLREQDAHLPQTSSRMSGALALATHGHNPKHSMLGGQMSCGAQSSGSIDLADAKPSILVVEDDADTCHFYAESLRLNGFSVREATDGYDAIERLKEELPDLILSDLRMPKMGGMALLHLLRADPVGRDIPYIILSGASDSETRIACLESGANDVLPKPIDSNELAVRLQLHVRQAAERRRLREQSYVDELTGLYNRRGTMQALERELSRVSRSTAPLAVLALDVDKFKSINDEFGHAAGDEVLRAIGAAVVSAVRTSDIVGRLGGDELLVVLPEVSELLANSIAYRIRQNVAELRIPGITKKLSVSIGVAVDTTGNVSSAELLKTADEDMYRNKRRQRPNLRAL